MTIRTAALAALLGSTALTAAAQEGRSFERVASFPVARNLPEGAESATAPEIVTATEDGMTLVYSDSPLEAIGMVDISDPAEPQPKGVVMLEGEPTSVTVIGGTAFATVNTSESFTEPSGHVAVIDLSSGAITRGCDLGGQPDSAAAGPGGAFLAVAIENERDEDLNDGAIPQLPAGFVAIIPLLDGALDCDAMVKADVTGLAGIAPSDPEPEFIDVNAAGEIAVTLQENNHVVILSREGEVLSHFSAGAIDLEGVDVDEEGALDARATLRGVKREPDAVQWLDADRLATANEGDYEGGSRGFTVFSREGEVLHESGLDFEREVTRIGHYPEGRSGNKGVEPEGMEVAEFDGRTLMFLLSERGSVVGVYDMSGETPELRQMLPSGVGPEGAVAIPSRGLFVTANEEDLREDGGPGAHLMIYALQDAPPRYPTLVSADADGGPIGWGALSGLAADPDEPARLYAVNDSFYRSQPSIFTIDASVMPAMITEVRRVTRDGAPAQKLDLEGIAPDGEGGFWLASEGRSDRLIPHALLRVDAEGAIVEEVGFPPELTASEIRFGAEGVARDGDRLWIAIQREWRDDPEGQVKLVSYDVASGEWGAVRYPLEAPERGWIGLSEIAIHGEHAYIVERDNQIGEAAAVKRLYRVPLSQLQPAPLSGELPVVEKELVRDFLPDLGGFGGYVVDKVEGFAIDTAGVGWAVTDNDGVDDSSGETFFWSVGAM